MDNDDITPEREKEILDKFYNKINKKCEENNISVSEFFFGGIDIQSSFTDKIQLGKFSRMLTQLDYDDENDDDEIKVIMEKFRNQFTPNYIDISIIEKNFNEFKENKKILKTFISNPAQTLKTLLKPSQISNQDNNNNYLSKSINKSNLENNNNNLEENENLKKENNNIEINDKNLEKSEEENNKKILKESIGVTAYINAIHEKIDNEKKRMLEELSKTSKFKMKNIYSKFKEILNTKEKMNEFEKKFYINDPLFTGNISKELFNEILDNTIVLSTEEINTIFTEIPNKGGKIYEYKIFIDNILKINDDDYYKDEKIFNLINNSYIKEIRNNIISKNIDIRNIWIDTFNSEIKCNKNDFPKLIQRNNLGNFQLLEIDYIFLILSFDSQFVHFKTFKAVMSGDENEINNLNYDNLYKEEKDEEEKKEKEEKEKEEEKKEEIDELIF